MLPSIDEAGRLISVKDAWLDKLGYNREEVLGRLSFDFLTLELRTRDQEHDFDLRRLLLAAFLF